MKTDEKYAKLLALLILFEKDEQSRNEKVRDIYCHPTDIPKLLKDITNEEFRQWVASVSHLFRSDNNISTRINPLTDCIRNESSKIHEPAENKIAFQRE